MPIYEYICKKCNEKFALFLHINAPTIDTSCPRCGSQDVNKIMSPFSCSLSDSSSSKGGSHSGFSGGG